MKKPLLLILTGPTAVGKTSVSIDIARYLNTEILSADSRQFYREMKIGTAAPSPEEQGGIPHHFIGHLSITENYNVSAFENDALNLLEVLFRKYKIIILTGGSGLYINAVCCGIDELPDPDEDLRNDLKQKFASEGIISLRNLLKKLDPDYYRQVDLNNPNRLLRAVEVSIQTGIPYSSLRINKKKERPFDIVKTALYRDREELNSRINSRVDQMINDGLETEVKALLPFRNLNALNTVGYKEFFDFFDGHVSYEQTVADIKTHSRRYAKRQMTWFRKDESISWFEASDQKGLMSFIENLREKYE